MSPIETKLLLKLNRGNRNEESLLIERTSTINQLLLHNKNSLVNSLFWKTCHKIHQLAFKDRQLKHWKDTFDVVWEHFLNVKLYERIPPIKIHHIIDIEKLLGVDNVNEYINNSSF